MNNLVGIIRKEDEITEALDKLDRAPRALQACPVDGNRPFNPGWHLAIDLRNMLLVSECVAKAALERTESRGGHTRDDHPSMESDWRKTLLVCRTDGDPEALVPDVSVTRQDQIPMRQDLLELFELSELEKYFTDGELTEHPERSRARWRYDAKHAGVARRPRRRRAAGLHGRGQRGRGGARHHPPPAGDPDARPGRAVELQGGQVRVVLGGGQRQAAADVHDPDVHLRRGRDHHGDAAADVPGHPRPGHRRVVQLREGPGDPVVHAAEGPAARRVPDAAGGREPQPGVPQVHRVLPVPEHLPRGARPRGEQAGVLRARGT